VDIHISENVASTLTPGARLWMR